MNRSALSYPLARGADPDPGGAADLQTDVMRFMAILSLCLVAIFALVQSIPPSERAAVTAADVPERRVAPPRTETPPPAQSVTRPLSAASVAAQAPAAVPATTDRPEPAPAEVSPPAAPEPRPLPEPAAAETTTNKGFTLRFESDTALTALVAQDKVGLYALRGDDARRLTIERGRLEFWAASVPSRYHEMDAPTVPAVVRRALRISDDEARDLRWGVTLPASMTKQLSSYLQSGDGGELVIGADGRLRLR